MYIYIYTNIRACPNSVAMGNHHHFAKGLSLKPPSRHCYSVWTGPSIELYVYLVPETSIDKWLLQLDDSKSLDEKWLFHQTTILTRFFEVPGIYIYLF